MSLYLYSFVGSATALNHYLKTSTAEDKEVALASTAELQSIINEILTASAGDSSEATFKELFGKHITTVLASIDTIRSTTAHQKLDATLTQLLEYFYAAAHSLMDGADKSQATTNFSPSDNFVGDFNPATAVQGISQTQTIVGSFDPREELGRFDSTGPAAQLDSFFK